MSHHISPRSVSTYMSGICNQLEPFFPNIREIRNHKIVTRSLKGCLKRKSVPVSRKRALTRSELANVVQKQHPPDHDRLLFLAILLTGFFALMRLAELVWPDNKSFQDYRKVTTRASVAVSHDSYSFMLPYHKADRFFEGNWVIIQSTDTPENPTKAFKSYLDSRDRRFPANPELWLKADGSIPTRTWFIKQLSTSFPGNVGGHSLRSGGATVLALAGIPPHIIQAMGRWASDTFRIYVRQHPALVAALVYGTRH